MHSPILNIVVQNSLAVFLANNDPFFAFRARLSQQAGFEMNCDHGSVNRSGKENISIETPTQICDSHLEGIHQDYQRLLQLWFPDCDGRFGWGESNDRVASELLVVWGRIIFLLIQRWVDPWDWNGFEMTAQGCEHIPICAINKGCQIVRAHFTSCRSNLGAIRRPRKSSEQTHRLCLAFVVDFAFSFLGDVSKILNAPDCQLSILARLTCKEFAKGIKSEPICFFVKNSDRSY